MNLIKMVKDALFLVFPGDNAEQVKLPVVGAKGHTIITIGDLLKQDIEVIDPALQNLRIPTSVSDVQADGHLYYRGIEIDALAEKSTAEESAYLLLRGDLPNSDQLADFKAKLAEKAVVNDETQKALVNALKAIPVTDKTDMMSLLATSITIMDAQEKLDTSNEEARYDSALRTMAIMPTLVGLINARLKAGEHPQEMAYRFHEAKDFGANGDGFSLAKLTLEALHQTTSGGQTTFDPLDADKIKAMETYLILHQEHGHNLSSLTARIVASAESKAGAWRTVLGGVESLQGNQHGNAAPDAFANIVKISKEFQGTPEEKAKAYFKNITDVKEQRKEQKLNGIPEKDLVDAKIPGVGHGIYKEGPDPRAVFLGKYLENLDIDSEYFKIAKKLHELVRESEYFGKSVNKAKNGKTYSIMPNVDYYSGILLTQYLDVDKCLLGPLFANGRTVGWETHAMEHKRDVGDLIMRPEAVSLAEQREYIPMEDRKTSTQASDAKAFPLSNAPAIAGQAFVA